jgi:putative acetyltransferase
VDRVVLEVADPEAADVRAVVQRQSDFGRSNTPPEYAHALGAEALADPALTLFCARENGRVVGIGGLRELDAAHGEIKSMHTVDEARGHGVGRAMVEHLLATARQRGYRRVSLETGTSDGFAPARALYASVGFEACAPFGAYPASPHNLFMTMRLV